LLKDDNLDSLVPTPKLKKEFWPHVIVTLVPMLSRVPMILMLIFLGVKGITFGSEESMSLLKFLFFLNPVAWLAMVVILIVAHEDIRKNGLIYAWAIC
jgi:hypothetical protein